MQKQQNAAMEKKLSDLLKARFPYIYIPTWEEERAIDMIKSVARDPEKIKTVRQLYIWSVTKGFECEAKATDKETLQPMRALDFIASCPEDAIFVLKDCHHFFGTRNRQVDFQLVRKLRDIIPKLKMGDIKKNVIFLSPELIIPDDMQKEISVLDFPLPTIEEIMMLLDEMIEDNKAVVSIELSTQGREMLAKAALGLTLQEAENAFCRAMVDGKNLDDSDIAIIFEEKNQVIKRSGILELVNSDVDLNTIGGLDNLKRWLQKRNNSWLDSAKKYNIPAPKGVLITGVPGCGKSLTAKAMSAMWQLPLLNLDMGKIFSGLVGSSEENLRQALKTAEAVAPSILWVDEIEKGFAGMSGGGSGDSGTSSRVFGTFLTWMQDKTAPVFVIATANNISVLPPELLRKGRFDEIFFVDIPTHRERKDIFRVHLAKRYSPEIFANIEVADPLLDKLARITEGFIGAEIEQVVIAALYEAFFEDRPLKETDFEYAIRNTVPLAVTQKEEILRLREWANVRAVAATSKEDLQAYTETGGGDEVTGKRGGRAVDG
jgi:SpoVK/Ycf46/Vps4 family AAA+-type ATPase